MAGSETPHILVLAAGRGRRMGGPKALMEVMGRPWWRWQRQRLSPVGLPEVWVVSPEVREGIARESSSTAMPPLLIEASPDQPMFASLLAGLDAPRVRDGSGVFVLPVDVPAPRPPVWAALAKTDRPAAPRWRGCGGHPLFLPHAWVNDHLPPMTDPAGRLDRLVAPDLLPVDVDDPSVRFNFNTPADVQSWLEEVNGRPA